MNLFIFFVEVPRTLFKGTANRRQNEFIHFFVEVPRTLSKGTSNRRQNEFIHFFC